MRQVRGADGNIAATIDSSGRVMLGSEPGPIIGLLRSDAHVFEGELGIEDLGRIDADSRVYNAMHEAVGSVDASGRVMDIGQRTVGYVELPGDGAVLLLLVARHAPGVLEHEPPADAKSPMMDEALSLAEEDRTPHIRKNYKPLTDDDVFGRPHKR